MSSQQRKGIKPEKSPLSQELILPEQPSESASDDTVLVWREVKYYRTVQQPRMDGLYADFREVFDGWTQERFKKVDPEAVRALKHALRSGGVNTGPSLKHSAEALADIAQLPCVEDGMWPRLPKWDPPEFLRMSFNPGSEAHGMQQGILEAAQRQYAAEKSFPAPPPNLPLQQTQFAPPQAPNPQAPAAQGQSPSQVPAQQTFSAPRQGPPFQGPPVGMQAQPGPAMVPGPPQQPPGPPMPPPQARPPQGFPRLGESPFVPRQSQQQPGAQPQPPPSPPPPNSGATRSPQPSLRHPPGAGNNRNHRAQPYPVPGNPSKPTLKQAAMQRAALQRQRGAALREQAAAQREQAAAQRNEAARQRDQAAAQRHEAALQRDQAAAQQAAANPGSQMPGMPASPDRSVYKD